MDVNKRQVEKLLTGKGQEVSFLQMSGFPISKAESSVLRELTNNLVSHYKSRNNRLSMVVTISQRCLYTGLLDTFVDNASKWLPEQGLAVTPHKRPPQIPDKSEFINADPRLISEHGVEGVVDLPEFIFQVTDDAAKKECCDLMSGHGALSIFLTSLKYENLHQKWHELFGKKVTDKHFKNMPLFIPLFGVKSFLNAADEDLSSWFGFFDLFIGESKEDNGILIASRENIDDLIDNILIGLPVLSSESVPEKLRW